MSELLRKSRGSPAPESHSSQGPFGIQTIKRLLKPTYLRFRETLPTSCQVSLDFLIAHGRLPNLRNPKTFNEKMAWRKLYDHDPRFPDLIDKIKVKNYIAARYGQDLIIPTLATYERVSDLDFSRTPLHTPPYVIKTNHGCGFNVFVEDGAIDQQEVKQTLDRWLGLNFANVAHEWGYKSIAPKILVEPLLGNGSSPTDYKFHVFRGKVYAIEVVLHRFTNYWIDFYDRQWRQLDVTRYAKRPRSDLPITPPRSLDRMIDLAEDIGNDFSYVRVDLYEMDNTVKFGELSFYAGSAYDRFEPADWDKKFGAQWHLQ